MGIELLAELSEAIIDGAHANAEQLTKRLLEGGTAPQTILEQGLLPGMEVVGRRFRENQIYLPQVLVSARAMKASMKLLEPFLAAAKVETKGIVLIGTVKGDLHDIGKNLVSILLQGAGFRVIDIGVDCSPSKFSAAIHEHKPDIVALSALLTTTMLSMKTTIETLRGEGITLPIIVGGAPLNQKFADSIGATAYARNASEAVDVVKRVLHVMTP
jgi:5-methyltetrahydrofolate--homocysteine methyltransferase